MKEMEQQLSRVIPDEKTPNEDRLVMLCDGVFAIAATLLVLDIGINPGRFGSTTNDLTTAVNAALPQLIGPCISYLVTFLIIAFYWRTHRSLMQVVQHLDAFFISLTFLFLAFIAFFPVTSKLLGNYAPDPLIIVIYTLGLSGCSLTAFALWLYATWHHRLISPDLPQDLINTRAIALLLNPLIYCASLLLLFVVPPDQPYLICFSWVLIGLSQRGVRYVYTRWLVKPVQELLHHEHEQNVEPPAEQNQPVEKLPDMPVDGVAESAVGKAAEEVELP
jgi:uncharacterized membrane protein